MTTTFLYGCYVNYFIRNERQVMKTASTLQLPTSGTFVLDPAHTDVSFVVKHMVVAKVRGRFNSFEGKLDIADSPSDSSVAVSIDASSIDTGNNDRDNHLRSPDFLDVENHPTLEFVSRSVDVSDLPNFRVNGDLTIRGTTKPVTLEGELSGTTTDPWGNERAIFTASTEIDREDFGLTWNQALETGGVLVGKKVRIELDIQAVKQ